MSNDDQEVELVKKFIKEYGPWIVAGLVIGLGSMFAWRNYQAVQVTNAETKTSTYQQLVDELRRAETFAETDNANAALAELAGSSYAALTRLQLASIAVNDGELDEAAQLLATALTETSRLELKELISLRLARVHIAQGDYAGAAQVLKSVGSENFAALKAEVEGDLFFAQEQLSAAKVAYAQAVALSPLGANPLLQMKLDNLAAY